MLSVVDVLYRLREPGLCIVALSRNAEQRREVLAGTSAIAAMATLHGPAVVGVTDLDDVPFRALGADLLVKLVPPVWIDAFHRELTALAQVGGQLGLATPRLVAHEQLDGWGVLVQSRFAGVEAGLV